MREDWRRSTRATLLTSAFTLVAAIAACAGESGKGNERLAATKAAIGSSPTTAETPIGLAIGIEDDHGVPLKVRAGQRFFLDQIDLRAAVDATIDEGVAGLDTGSTLAELDWTGVKLMDEEPVLLPGPDGKYTRRRFYRKATWMNAPSSFVVEQIDASGAVVGEGTVVNTGTEADRASSDDFFVRRFRAIQWTYDCPGLHDCTGASHFSEEALVELRTSMHPQRTFAIRPATTALRVHWSLLPGRTWSVPVSQIATPPYDYGFSIDLTALTPAGAGGAYAPGSNVEFKLKLRDGAGNPLHPDGELPPYNEVVFGANPAGIQYYRAFFDPTTTYYRRKHRERMLMSQIIGPAQKVQPIRTIIDLPAFLGPEEVQTLGLPARDGVYAQFITFPPAPDLFGGAFDPAHAGWAKVVKDTWTYHLPSDAEPGTYLVTIKGRRTYLGQDIPFSRTIEIQVGTAVHTTAALKTGPCTSCHSGSSALSNVLHANDNRAACSGCHTPLGFELEGPIYVRLHFLHSRSNRVDAPLQQCSSCHLTKDSIERTSKSACLSCHSSYPASHVEQFGPIGSMYVGGGRESFGQCTSSCHTNHPASGL
jgi:predicted CXXCH cytochrome family protein